MSVAIITGAGGLVGSESVRAFSKLGLEVIGIDNDLRKTFFGDEASTAWNTSWLQKEISSYRHEPLDIRDENKIHGLFKRFGNQVKLIIHAAAQPSHDWAARDPQMDFTVNANGTLNLLEAYRKYCPEAVFIFTSTNKVYGDAPNLLPLIEKESRYEIDPNHAYQEGIPETLSVDQNKHSLFGASKLAADILVQEYGRYFNLRTGVFRGGCISGPRHSGAALHGFLAYLMKCTMSGIPYQVIGYQGKQVRDNMHCSDLVAAFEAFFRKPIAGAVFNLGGGRASNCSMREAISYCESITQKKLAWTYEPQPRSGDHIWYITDLGKFQRQYPEWKISYDIPTLLQEIYEFRKAHRSQDF